MDPIRSLALTEHIELDLTVLDAGRVWQLTARGTEPAPLSCASFLRQLACDGALQDGLTRALAAAPFAALFWECRPLSRATLNEAFECVLVDAPALARLSSERGPFAAQLDRDPQALVAIFPNLGHDALLVAPTGHGSRATPAPYAHLAAFCRTAPAAEQRALWSTVAQAALDRVRETPFWLSTSGLGIAWLHVRLDERPKYLTWAPYARTDRYC